jgi:hypothetical protein
MTPAPNKRTGDATQTQGEPILELVVAPAGAGKFTAYLDDRELCTSTKPFLDAARVLLAEGVDPATALQLLEPQGLLETVLGFTEIVFLAIREDHGIGVLLDRSAVAQVGKLRTLLLALLDRPGQLRQRQDGDLQMSHAGNNTLTLRTTIGNAAGLTVLEGDLRPRFGRWQAFKQAVAKAMAA